MAAASWFPQLALRLTGCRGRPITMSSEVQRKLTTILAADAEGYAREMDANEVRALGALQAARGVFAKFIERYHGRIANTAGDGLIAEFPSVVEAVQCAIEVQRELGHEAANEGALRFRIGIHLGDVLVDGDDLLGEGVNLAARLQTLAEPGSVLISQQVYDQVQKKLSVGFEYIGDRRPKNFADDVAVYRIASSEEGNRRREAPKKRTAKSASGGRDGRTLREDVVRQAVLFGRVLIVLVLLDLVTGATFWAHWPALGMAALLGLRAAPLLVRGGTNVFLVRVLVVVALLGLIRLFT